MRDSAGGREGDGEGRDGIWGWRTGEVARSEGKWSEKDAGLGAGWRGGERTILISVFTKLRITVRADVRAQPACRQYETNDK